MDFTNVGDNKVECFCLIKSLDKRTKKDGKPYLNIDLSDKTGEINAKYWDYDPATDDYSVGDIVKVRGRVEDFNGGPQLRIERIRHTRPDDNIKAEDYVPSASFGGEQMYYTLISIAESFKDEDLKKIALSIYADYREKLLYWPAAYKLHHAMRGGLLMHTLSIVRLCEAVCAVYPFIDRDLLIAGAMLHDIAKTDEYEVSDSGTAKGYSVRGNLLGHISMGAEIVGKYAEKLGVSEKTATLLKHMILSHHGVPEFGAAVRPMTLEAEVLSELDLMDARLFEIKEALSSTDKGAFSAPQWALDNVKLFNHARKELTEDPDLL